MQVVEQLLDLAKFLRDQAEIIDGWARESRDGGWSTHQVDANRKLADKCRERARQCEELARQTVVT